jgi:hypothetical protein
MVINVILYSPFKSITRQEINSKDRKLEIKFHFLIDVSVQRQIYSVSLSNAVIILDSDIY